MGISFLVFVIAVQLGLDLVAQLGSMDYIFLSRARFPAEYALNPVSGDVAINPYVLRIA